MKRAAEMIVGVVDGSKTAVHKATHTRMIKRAPQIRCVRLSMALASLAEVLILQFQPCEIDRVDLVRVVVGRIAL